MARSQDLKPTWNGCVRVGVNPYCWIEDQEWIEDGEQRSKEAFSTTY